MYNAAELFVMASDPKAVKEIFLNSVTLSVEDAASGCVDLDAEKERLSTIWDVAHLSMRELVDRTGLSQTAFAKQAGIPRRTVQGWCLGERDCPEYVRFLLAEHYGLI
jgi:DNA-binding transcriptional regulator YiaG